PAPGRGIRRARRLPRRRRAGTPASAGRPSTAPPGDPIVQSMEIGKNRQDMSDPVASAPPEDAGAAPRSRSGRSAALALATSAVAMAALIAFLAFAPGPRPAAPSLRHAAPAPAGGRREALTGRIVFASRSDSDGRFHI